MDIEVRRAEKGEDFQGWKLREDDPVINDEFAITHGIVIIYGGSWHFELSSRYPRAFASAFRGDYEPIARVVQTVLGDEDHDISEYQLPA